MESKTYGKLYHESVHNTANHGDEVKCIPRVFKVALQRTKKSKYISFGSLLISGAFCGKNTVTRYFIRD